MSDVSQEVAKLEAFIAPEPSVAGLTLRPLTAGTLILLKRVGNALVEGRISQNPEEDVASFIYIHSADPKEVRKLASDKQAYFDKVVEFADTLKIPDFIKAAEQVKRIIETAMVGQDYQVDEDAKDPN